MTAPINKLLAIREVLDDPIGMKDKLSDRELEVARLRAKGWMPKQIAAQLKVKPGTVWMFLDRVRMKTGVSSGDLTRKMMERLEEALE